MYDVSVQLNEVALSSLASCACSQWAMVVVGVATAFCSNYYLFCVLRFFAGALQQVRQQCTKKHYVKFD